MLLIYWPGMINSICSKRYNCKHCNEIAPSQTREPLMVTPSPDWPFHLIRADYFKLNNRSYLAIVDRFSGWLNIYPFKPGCSINPFATQFLARQVAVWLNFLRCSFFCWARFRSSPFTALQNNFL